MPASQTNNTPWRVIIAGGESGGTPTDVEVTNTPNVVVTSTVLPTLPTLLTASGTLSAGDNTGLIAAPGAGLRVYLTSVMMQNTSANAQSLILKSATTEKKRVYCKNQGDGIAISHNPLPLPMGVNEAVNITATDTGAYSFTYYVAA